MVMMFTRRRMIDATPLENQFKNLAESWQGTFSGPAYLHALERLKKAPTVDAVEVVRCGKCRYCDTIDCPMSGTPGKTSANDFCSYGERKT